MTTSKWATSTSGVTCALVLGPDGRPVTFLTQDRKQKQIATRIGFDT